jgi:hypothetical protein
MGVSTTRFDQASQSRVGEALPACQQVHFVIAVLTRPMRVYAYAHQKQSYLQQSLLAGRWLVDRENHIGRACPKKWFLDVARLYDELGFRQLVTVVGSSANNSETRDFAVGTSCDG